MAKKKQAPRRGKKKGTVNVNTIDAGRQIILQQIITRPVNRRRADIEAWRRAHQAAENTIHDTRTTLYDLYDDVMLDATLSSIVDKRIMAVTNTKIRFVRDGEDVDDVQAIIKTEAFKEILREIMLSKLWGITVLDIPFYDKVPMPFSIPRKHIRPKTGIIAKEQTGVEGFSYREGMYQNTILEVGKPDDFGILLKAVPYVLYKRGAMGDWAQFVEIFGMPMRVAKYSGYDTQTKAALEEAMDASGSALSMTIPEEAQIEFKESNNAGARADIFNALKKACNEELQILILGQTGTTEDGQGSGYAQAKIHAQTEDDINADDRSFVLSVLESKFNHILDQAGFNIAGGEWMFEDPEEDISLKDRVSIDTALKNAGLPIDDEYFYERYDIPKPDNYDALRQAQTDKEKEESEKKDNPPKKKKAKKSGGSSPEGSEDVELSLSILERIKNFFG